ncbi:MAG: hypothetical protein IH623_06325, partial [Verrucomicrobia bacterium]|nr:hypothetical protein [Verrucomicrobiota bacterium]
MKTTTRITDCHRPQELPFAGLGLLLVWLCLITTSISAQHYQVLHHFNGDDGREPLSLVVSGTRLYGTAWGGSFHSGVLFKLNTDGSEFTVLKEFAYTNGSTPMNLLLSGSTLFGITYQGGARGGGIVFKINTDGSGFTILKHLGEASNRAGVSGLAMSGTTLYGTTTLGGADELGSLFKLETDGSGFSVLRELTLYGSGIHPQSPVVDGLTLYGTALGGGSGGGSVFRLHTDGSGFSVLKLFTGPDGHYPGMVLQSSGTALHGVTTFGGYSWNGKAGSGYGTVFNLNTDGSNFTVLKQFDGTNGAHPRHLLMAGSMLYGLASGGGCYEKGTLFQMQTDGTGFTAIESFTGGHGAGSGCLVLSGDTLFGTTVSGGIADKGVIFSRPLGPLPPAILAAPQSQTIEKGRTMEFAVEASGHPAFQWFFNHTNVVVTGTGPFLQLTNVQPSQAGDYTVVLSNAVGVVTSTPAILTVVPLTIAIPPRSQTVEEGGTVEFRVETIGYPETYQWYFNAIHLLAGETNAVLRLDSAQLAHAGSYTVIIANDAGAVTSPPASLTVIPLGTIPVASPTEGALRAAMAGAQPVTFACDGDIRLSRPIDIVGDKVLDGSGRQVTISGGGLVRVFDVPTNSMLTLVNLTIANGMSTNGGGVYIAGGTVRATNCVFWNNQARGLEASYESSATAADDGCGGAVYSE